MTTAEDFPPYKGSNFHGTPDKNGLLVQHLGPVTQKQRKLLEELQAEHRHTLDIEFTEKAKTYSTAASTSATAKSRDKTKIAWVEWMLADAGRKAIAEDQERDEMRSKVAPLTKLLGNGNGDTDTPASIF